MWKLLKIDGKEETEKTYIVEATQRIEKRQYDNLEVKNCFVTKLISETTYSICYTKEQALKRIATYERLGDEITLYHISIRDIENMLRRIYRTRDGII